MQKKIGNMFENEVLKKLENNGWWAHKIAPAINGSQPFDIIAVKPSIVLCLECKNIATGYNFQLSRVEDNQYYVMKKMQDQGVAAFFVFKANKQIYKVAGEDVINAVDAGEKKIDVRMGELWEI